MIVSALALMAGTSERNLVISPPSLVGNWAAEIRKHTRNCKVIALQTVAETAEFDFSASVRNVYLISSVILRMTFANYPNCKLFKFKFYRCILDEGHQVCKPTTALYKSSIQIVCTYRWLLTGISAPILMY